MYVKTVEFVRAGEYLLALYRFFSLSQSSYYVTLIVLLHFFPSVIIYYVTITDFCICKFLHLVSTLNIPED